MPQRVAVADTGSTAARWSERGEVFPVAILFGGVLLTVLIGVHVVLDSMARSATQAAADYGAVAARATLPGPSSCGHVSTSYVPSTEPECQGITAAMRALSAASASVALTRLPLVQVDYHAGLVRVTTFGGWNSPVLGQVEVRGSACAVLEHLSTPSAVSPGPTPPTPSAAAFQC